VNNDGQDVLLGEIGEIIIRGLHVIEEYYKETEKTAEAIADGWFYTQDSGRLDKDGFQYIVERKHTMIISGGENIYPKEVEDVLFRHPKIEDAAVFGLPDLMWRQRVCAAIVPESGKQINEDEIMDFCEVHSAGYKKPKYVFLLESIPLNSVGKVLRDELKNQLQEE